ncbi:hypothetical protein G3O08_05260 [Cryomorpha ignava]|uniref:Uncharacterized protein n=1 Tax=Cryomorpha ignava TaxID=101383 RepID=A0A7K3WQ72_9FLAO|nr:hypothetical protein [Cryomorpha ignava]NEN22905.1 hypothetical protein [Cryomorpha ignava]
MQPVAQFHFLAHSGISLIGAILLFAIYYNIRRRFSAQIEDEENFLRVDKGLIFLSFALFTWVAAGIWGYAFSLSQINREVDFAFQIAFSLLNNIFFLLALYYFDHAPEFIYRNKRSRSILTILVLVVALLSILLTEDPITMGNLLIQVNAIPDLIFSFFLSGILGYTLYRTFNHRRLQVVAVLSLLIIASMFLSQFPQVVVNWNNNFESYLIKLISKTSLIALFLVLAASWVIELANTPKPAEIRLHFTDWSRIVLSIPSKNIQGVEIDFGSKTTQFKNLLKFSIRRKFGEGDNQCLDVSSGGEIKSQAYVTRIPDNINEILKLQGDDRLDRKDLFTFLGEGKYRLRLLPDTIDIEKGLLQEFLKMSENQSYKTIVSNCNSTTEPHKG